MGQHCQAHHRAFELQKSTMGQHCRSHRAFRASKSTMRHRDTPYTSVVDVCNTNSCVHSNYAPEHISIRVIKAITTLSWRMLAPASQLMRGYRRRRGCLPHSCRACSQEAGATSHRLSSHPSSLQPSSSQLPAAASPTVSPAAAQARLLWRSTPARQGGAGAASAAARCGCASFSAVRAPMLPLPGRSRGVRFGRWRSQHLLRAPRSL